MVILELFFFLVQFLEPAPLLFGMFFPSLLIPFPATIGKIHDFPLLHDHHPDLKHSDDSQTKIRHSILKICLWGF